MIRSISKRSNSTLLALLVLSVGISVNQPVAFAQNAASSVSVSNLKNQLDPVIVTLKNNIPGGQELVNYLVNGEKYCSKKCVRDDHYCLKKGTFE